MTNHEVWEIYSEYTKDTTQYARKIAFAGGAICWLFKNPQTLEQTFPYNINLALVFLMFFFVLDILQGLSAILIRRFWNQTKEKEFKNEYNTIEKEYFQPKWIDTPPFIFFLIKLTSLLFAFFFIAKQIIVFEF